MRTLLITSVLFAIGATAGNTLALADEHDNHQYVRHEEWKKGAKIEQGDWGRGEHVDYQSHHLRAPPHGYEWRLVDGNYVLAAVATGIISSVVVAEATGH
jgi:Ni/Co efflux regulator RcnB